MEEIAYPKSLAAWGGSNPNSITVKQVSEKQPMVYAEIGCYLGHTTTEVAKVLPAGSTIHLFDFQHNLDATLAKVKHPNIICHVNTMRWRDSYCWSLLQLIKDHEEPIFDYVFLDGAHTWDIDGYAFFLIDKLLKRGGLLDFDDYGWTLANSPTQKPAVWPMTAKLYR